MALCGELALEWYEPSISQAMGKMGLITCRNFKEQCWENSDIVVI